MREIAPLDVHGKTVAADRSPNHVTLLTLGDGVFDAHGWQMSGDPTPATRSCQHHQLAGSGVAGSGDASPVEADRTLGGAGVAAF